MQKIAVIPALSDNYIFIAARDGDAVVVDPGEAAPVLAHLESQGLSPSAILITHHHGDHIDGLAELKSRFPDAEVFGPAGESIPGVHRQLREGESVPLFGGDWQMKVIDTPGHTSGHISFFGEDILFCGDALFACGCGRMFEGTPEQMSESLAKLAALPGATRFFCGHEYTLGNISFAREVEPQNADIIALENNAKEKRAQNIPTIPSTIADELATNPFIRTNESAVIKSASHFAGRELSSRAEVFAALRKWKDDFIPQKGG